MLHGDLAENPGDPVVLFDLGNVHFNLGNYFHAECYLNECLQRINPSDASYRPAAARLVESHLRKGDPERAREVAEYARQRLPEDAEFAARLCRLSTSNFGGAAENGIPRTRARLYLGAGNKRLHGYFHVDIQPADGIDVAWDLNTTPWPWDDDAACAIVAEDLVEHLDIGLVGFCDEAWRVLRPGGELFVRTPHHEGKSSWIDPTHRWHLGEEAFHYLDPAREWGRLYSHYTPRKWRLVHLAVRGPQNIHAILVPRK